MASRKITDCFAILANAYEKACIRFQQKYPNEPQPFCTCSVRTGAEQDLIYKQATDGIDNNGNGKIDEPSEKVSCARAGESPHNFVPSFAFDIAFINLKQQLDWSPRLFKMFAEIVVEIEPNIEWGGSWAKLPDAPHFQLRGWKEYVNKQNLKHI